MAEDERARLPAGIRVAGLFALITVAYAIGAELSWQSFGSGAAFGFPPAGLTVAALLLTSRKRWPVVIAAIVLAEVGVDIQHHLSLLVALGSAGANVVEPVVGASAARRWCRGVPDLTARGDLFRFIAAAVLLGPAAGAVAGATVITSSSGGWWPGLALEWMAGDGIAVLVIGGPILLWARRQALARRRWPELVLLVAVTIGLSDVAFSFGEPASVLVLPMLVLIAFRVGDLGVVLAGAGFAAVADYMTAAGSGEFAHMGLPPPAAVAVTQAYIATAVLIGWILAQEVADRMSAVHDRDRARQAGGRAESRRLAAELGASLADAATVSEVGEQVTIAVQRHVGAAHVVINVLDSDGQNFEQLAGTGAAAQLTTLAAEWTVTSDVPGSAAVRGGCAVYLPDRLASGAGFEATQPLGDALGLRAAAALPLMTEIGALGYLGVWWREPRQTTAVERAYLESMAETTSRALERTRLRQAERRERERVEMLAELTGQLADALTAEMIGRVVADRVRAAVGADGLSLGMISEDRQSLGWIAIAGYPDQLRERFVSLPLSRRTATTDAAVAGRPVILPSREDYSREYPDTFRRATAGSAASWLAWPLRAGQASFGSLTLMWRRPQRFGAGQLAFIAAVADLVAQALVRAKVYADEHAIAAILQKAVTPDLVAGIPGLDIGACYRQAGASMAIGGDWYDALALPGGGGYIAVGDVVGHGLAAVEDMTQLRNAARALAVAGHQPSSLLHELARFNSVATSGKFATMAVAIFAPDGTHATCGMAGHPPMLIRRAGTGTVERLSGVSDPPLVPFDDVTYAQFAISLEPGDVMLLYTDGLMERRGENPEEGIKRITKELRAWQPAVPLEAFCQELVTVLAVDPQPDDICVLAVRRPEVSSWPGG